MTRDGIDFREGTATKKDIYAHLTACDDAFQPHLSLKVDIGEYATKISTRARTFEAWSHAKLVGLVAAYMNDLVTRIGFITSVSVARDFAGQGIATTLLERCLKASRNEGVKAIRLEVSLGSDEAIRLYRRMGFSELSRDGGTVSMELTMDETPTS